MTYKKNGQFEPTKQNLKKVAGLYGHTDFTFMVADTGIENSTIIINSKPTFVVRVYRYAKKSDDDITREIDFMQTLHESGISVPQILLNTSNEYVTKFTIDGIEWRAIAMEYISGHHPESYTDKIVDQLATNQAAMHKVGIRYAQQVGVIPELELRPGEFTDQINDDELTDNKIKSLIRRVRDYTVKLDKGLPYGFVHNDYDIENTLFDDNDNLMSTLDFDDLVVMPVVVCLAFSLWSVLFDTFETDDELVREYVDAYAKLRGLTASELLNIPHILLFRHYAISSLFVLEDEMDSAMLEKCEKIEAKLIEMIQNKQYF